MTPHHFFTPRCSVRKWASLNRFGWPEHSRSSTALAVMSGSSSSHARISGQTPSKGSGRVRQWRGPRVLGAWVGRASPLCHRLGNWARNWSRLFCWDTSPFSGEETATSAAWAVGAGPGDGPLTIDLDSTICETHGLAKQGAHRHGYTHRRGYHPLLAVAAGTGDVLMARLREGQAHTGRGAGHFLRETVSRVRYAGAKGQLTMRADSGFYTHPVVRVCRQQKVRFSITVRLRQSLRHLIEAIPEGDWRPIPYWMEGGADAAETTYIPFRTESDAAPVRLTVRRVRPSPCSQLSLFASYSYHAFITDREGDTLDLEADHHRHAEIKNTIRDLKYGVGLNHLPSGRFAANGAWLAVQVMAHNLARWTARIGLDEGVVPPRPYGAVSFPWPEGSPARPDNSSCTCPGAGLGKSISSLPWHGCGPFLYPPDAILIQGNLLTRPAN